MKVICDIETNALEDPTVVWCVVCKDIETEDVHVFTKDDYPRFRDFSKSVDLWIGHNFVEYDAPVLRRLLGVEISYDAILDTLLLSRLFNYGALGGHSLDAWGSRLGFPKPVIHDFTRWSPEIVDRCISDVEINWRVYKKFEPYLTQDHYKDAISLEHNILAVCQQMTKTGFYFNRKEAERLHAEITDRLHTLESTFMREFKPKKVVVKEFVARATKDGLLHRGDFRWYDGDPNEKYSPGDLVQRVEHVPFDPASPKQRIDRLWDAGWNPVEKTKTHLRTINDLKYCRDKERKKQLQAKLSDRFNKYGWKLNEENLSTLPASAPEGARALAQWITLDSRRSSLVEWLGQCGTDSRIHGRFNPIGAWSHRMSHQNPNTANIYSHPDVRDPDEPSPVEQIKLDYNMQLRALWQASPNCLLVGCDATSIQLRMLAHFMGDDDFIQALLGNKDDVHGLNAIRLGVWDGKGKLPPEVKYRAKRFIYAWLLGAGVGKIMEILGCSEEEARASLKMFIESMPGLEKLKAQQKKDHERGYFIAIDGRYIPVPKDAPHKVMSGYLQSGEAIIMKRARLIWGSELKGAGVWFNPVNFVHDEWQTEVENDNSIGQYVGDTQSNSIRKSGERYGLRIRLDGDYQIGLHWAETH